MKNVTVREHARLSVGQTPGTLDETTVSQSAFDWLASLQGRMKKAGASLVVREGQTHLRLDNYVGVIQTPCGTSIEILPKLHSETQDVKRSRSLLAAMIASALDLPARTAETADIETFRAPLSDWVIEQFLREVELLTTRGLRSEYGTVSGEHRFLKGRLLMNKQVHQRPDRAQYLHQEYRIFHVNRPENRLIHAALMVAASYAEDTFRKARATQLLTFFHGATPTRDIEGDFRRWSFDRLMFHYGPVHPWCSLLLRRFVPMAVKGNWHGVSILFPMERLYEDYLGKALKKRVQPSVRVVCQARSEHLCQLNGENWFQLKPDFLLIDGERKWVADAKWKSLEVSPAKLSDHYGLSQSDFYQMLAYGHKYLEGRGSLYLIYPAGPDFDAPVGPFRYHDELLLWVLPFDLYTRAILFEGTPLPLKSVASAPLAA